METTISWILKISVFTLATIVVSVVAVLLVGLFVTGIDNNKIFEILGPAFNTVVGAFVGLLGGISLNNAARKEQNKDEFE
jgi:hypothetical protein